VIAPTLALQMAIANYSITVKTSAAVSLSSGEIVDAIAPTLALQMAVAFLGIAEDSRKQGARF
jgi:hypothetical protein